MTQPVSIRSIEPTDGRKRNRPQAVAETIKDWIIAQGLAPGDRLPQEPQLIEELGVSKGTVREALKVLETQGLIRTRTGPGGGAFITEVSDDHAGALLANHFLLQGHHDCRHLRDAHRAGTAAGPRSCRRDHSGTDRHAALLHERLSRAAIDNRRGISPARRRTGVPRSAGGVFEEPDPGLYLRLPCPAAEGSDGLPKDL